MFVDLSACCLLLMLIHLLYLSQNLLELELHYQLSSRQDDLQSPVEILDAMIYPEKRSLIFSSNYSRHDDDDDERIRVEHTITLHCTDVLLACCRWLWGVEFGSFFSSRRPPGTHTPLSR